MLSAVVRQPIPKIFVGDQHQQIYGFRGAANALGAIKADVTYHLTQVCEKKVLTNFYIIFLYYKFFLLAPAWDTTCSGGNVSRRETV